MEGQKGNSAIESRVTIAVDFDGTLAIGAWPDADSTAVKWNDVVAKWVLRHIKAGDRVILWTCRENYGGIRYPDGEYLNDAVRCCIRHQLFFKAVNRNAGEEIGEYLSGNRKYGRKVTADAYIDDKSVPFDINGKMAGIFWRIYLYFIDRKLDRLRE